MSQASKMTEGSRRKAIGRAAAWNKANPARRKAIRATYYVKHREECAEYAINYNIINRQKVQERGKRYRMNNREEISIRHSVYYKQNQEKVKAISKKCYEKLKAGDPWKWRVRCMRHVNLAITVEWLRLLWDAQSGRCALTGRDLDIRTAELDHIVPRSKNGTHDLENLRLVVPEANMAKGSLTDAELLCLCKDILEAAKFAHALPKELVMVGERA